MSHREWFTTLIPEVNFNILMEDLIAAGFTTVEGLSANLDSDQVAVDFPDGQPPDAGQIATIQGIIDGHDATDYVAIVQDGAESQASAIPNWATWTESEVTDWIDTNVVDLASAKTAIRAMARMIVALRNQTWPRLQGS